LSDFRSDRGPGSYTHRDVRNRVHDRVPGHEPRTAGRNANGSQGVGPGRHEGHADEPPARVSAAIARGGPRRSRDRLRVGDRPRRAEGPAGDCR
jgi:hypothetical protein